jgi:hypothetical protein
VVLAAALQESLDSAFFLLLFPASAFCFFSFLVDRLSRKANPKVQFGINEHK